MGIWTGLLLSYDKTCYHQCGDYSTNRVELPPWRTSRNVTEAFSVVNIGSIDLYCHPWSRGRSCCSPSSGVPEILPLRITQPQRCSAEMDGNPDWMLLPDQASLKNTGSSFLRKHSKYLNHESPHASRLSAGWKTTFSYALNSQKWRGTSFGWILSKQHFAPRGFFSFGFSF